MLGRSAPGHEKRECTSDSLRVDVSSRETPCSPHEGIQDPQQRPRKQNNNQISGDMNRLRTPPYKYHLAKIPSTLVVGFYLTSAASVVLLSACGSTTVGSRLALGLDVLPGHKDLCGIEICWTEPPGCAPGDTCVRTGRTSLP